MALVRVGSACISDMLVVLLMGSGLVFGFSVAFKSQWVKGLPKRLDVIGPTTLAVSAPAIGKPTADLINFLRFMHFVCLNKYRENPNTCRLVVFVKFRGIWVLFFFGAIAFSSRNCG